MGNQEAYDFYYVSTSLGSFSLLRAHASVLDGFVDLVHLFFDIYATLGPF